jgi:hypothetical protein
MYIILENGDRYHFELKDKENDIPLSVILFEIADFMENMENGTLETSPYGDFITEEFVELPDHIESLLAGKENKH